MDVTHAKLQRNFPGVNELTHVSLSKGCWVSRCTLLSAWNLLLQSDCITNTNHIDLGLPLHNHIHWPSTYWHLCHIYIHFRSYRGARQDIYITAWWKLGKWMLDISVSEKRRTRRTFPMARPKCLMGIFTNLYRIYKAHQTNVWWTMKVFRLHWDIVFCQWYIIVLDSCEIGFLTQCWCFKVFCYLFWNKIKVLTAGQVELWQGFLLNHLQYFFKN